MRVAEVITDTNIGGAGILLVNRLKYSDKERFETTVVLPSQSKLKKRFNDIGISTVEIDRCRDRSFEFAAIREYVSAIRKISPDIVNCHGSLSGRISARICKVPVSIYTRHCAYPVTGWKKSTIGKVIIGGIQTILSDAIIAVAQAAKKDLVDMGTPESLIHVIINGAENLRRLSEEEKIRIRKELSIPVDATVVSICARLEPCKGHDQFLEAARILTTRSDNFRFLIIGEGSLSEQLKAFCKKNKVDDKIIFIGFADDVAPYLNVTDINVNCSVGTETSSLALSEGMSLGIPSVASDYGGNTYMVKNGVNGYIYPVGRYDVLADKIQALSDDTETYKKMSDNAYSRFLSELNAKSMTKNAEKLYNQLFSEKKR